MKKIKAVKPFFDMCALSSLVVLLLGGVALLKWGDEVGVAFDPLFVFLPLIFVPIVVSVFHDLGPQCSPAIPHPIRRRVVSGLFAFVIVVAAGLIYCGW